MIVAYFDCFSGVAGDMALGALLDCGVPLEELRSGVASLDVEPWEIGAEPVLRSGLHALSVHITRGGVSDVDEAQLHGGSAIEDHPAEHGHSHSHYEEPHHPHEPHRHGRSMAEIRAVIEGSGLSDPVKRTSLGIFERIAEAEAHLHHSTPDEVHFHEIGGLDSLIDICGTAWCLDHLGVEQVYASPLPYSSGTVHCAHGLLPVPAPATLELLKGVPTVPTDLRTELVTPTGAGIIVTLACGFGPPPAMTVRRVGYGSGKKQLPDRPNTLRVVIGEASAPADGLDWQSLLQVESNVDDMNPELYSFVMSSLFEAGALDVWLQPLQMKKNRPAVLLGALCAPDRRDAVIAAMLRQTTTLGVRVAEVRRAALPRRSISVATSFGEVRAKVAEWPGGGVRRATPEYDDVERLARQHGVPAHAVYQAAQAAATAQLEL